MNFVQIETSTSLAEGISQTVVSEATISPVLKPAPQVARNTIRTSLKASTLDGVFATIFSNVAGGVLLSNFLVELHANPLEIGFLSSVPMLVNLIQPLGAYLSDRTTSRHYYCLWIYGTSRLLWLILAIGIGLCNWHHTDPHQLVTLTLVVLLVSHILGALGSASWLSWLAALVPSRLRGRYFSIRNSAASLTNLISVPLLGLIVSHWFGGAIQGYGVVMLLGIVAGFVSLAFQNFMVDVNPQAQKLAASTVKSNQKIINQFVPEPSPNAETKIWQDANFLMFLVYWGLWMFSVNLSAPFFNIYMLDNLSLDISWVTLYSSLHAGAHLLMLIVWGKLADRTGNRPLLLLIGIVVALTPLLWLGTSANAASIWLWLPLLHVLTGGTWAAIDLCNNNIQLGIAPIQHQSTYFAIAAAVAGVSGALGTTAGGFLAEFANYGGLLGLFALSSVLRLAALLPLVFVQEQRRQSLRQVLRMLLPPQLRLSK